MSYIKGFNASASETSNGIFTPAPKKPLLITFCQAGLHFHRFMPG